MRDHNLNCARSCWRFCRTGVPGQCVSSSIAKAAIAAPLAKEPAATQASCHWVGILDICARYDRMLSALFHDMSHGQARHDIPAEGKK